MATGTSVYLSLQPWNHGGRRKSKRAAGGGWRQRRASSSSEIVRKVGGENRERSVGGVSAWRGVVCVYRVTKEGGSRWTDFMGWQASK